MLASCWDWNALKYAYYLIEGASFDAGGWSPSKGIVSKESKSKDNTVVCLEDCLPALPKNAFFAGAGDFLLGELFILNDKDLRPSINLDKMYASGKPREMKIVEMIRDSQNSCVLRNNPSPTNLGDPNPNNASTNTQIDHANIYKAPPTIWEKLLPLVMGAGIGYTVYSFSTGSLKLKDVLLVWSAGLAVGLSIGEESARQQMIKR